MLCHFQIPSSLLWLTVSNVVFIFKERPYFLLLVLCFLFNRYFVYSISFDSPEVSGNSNTERPPRMPVIPNRAIGK